MTSLRKSFLVEPEEKASSEAWTSKAFKGKKLAFVVTEKAKEAFAEANYGQGLILYCWKETVKLPG